MQHYTNIHIDIHSYIHKRFLTFKTNENITYEVIHIQIELVAFYALTC